MIKREIICPILSEALLDMDVTAPSGSRIINPRYKWRSIPLIGKARGVGLAWMGLGGTGVGPGASI